MGLSGVEATGQGVLTSGPDDSLLSVHIVAIAVLVLPRLLRLRDHMITNYVPISPLLVAVTGTVPLPSTITDARPFALHHAFHPCPSNSKSIDVNQCFLSHALTMYYFG